MIVSESIAKATGFGTHSMRYAANGWPTGLLSVRVISTTVYATTNWSAQPAVPPTALVRKIALGLAMLALLHSSARWKGESYLSALLDRVSCVHRGRYDCCSLAADFTNVP